MKVDTGNGELAREILGIPEEETVTLWEFPGIQGCLVAFHQEKQGLASCPLGFDQRLVPSQPESWMRGKCEDESWKDSCKQILEQCQLCRGKPRLSHEEAQRLRGIQESLFRRREKR